MFKKFLFVFYNFIIFIMVGMIGFIMPTNIKPVMSANVCPSMVFDKIIQFIKPNDKVEDAQVIERFKVYISGRPMGFSIDGGGVVVVTMGEIKTSTGYVKSPSEDAGVKIGDVIVRANGNEVTSGERLIDIVNNTPNKVSDLEILREGEVKNISVVPQFDDFALSYRLGVWVRDNAVGVGTITYVTENGGFSALGHPVTDIDTSTIFPVGDGSAYKCSIVGLKKGKKGEPGELKGLFLKTSNKIGDIETNTERGIMGRFVSEEVSSAFCNNELTEVALRKEVAPGKGTIYTTIDGCEPEYYDIEIIKTNHINSYGNKCMVIRITDEKLLNATGGIIQGMSGSPIIQNGKLVGCVTHVFINDPTKGFADFIDKKWDNSKNYLILFKIIQK